MKNRFALLVLLIASCTPATQSIEPFRYSGQRTLFNDAWNFTLDGAPSRELDLPHDWGVEGDFVQEYPGETGKLRWWGHAEYSKTLQVSAEDLNGRVFLEFGGAMSNACVSVNDVPVAGRAYGYSSFCADLTPALHEGPNEISVCLDNPEESSRWYPGGGIYRNVHLVKAPCAGADPWRSYVLTEGNDVTVHIGLRNSGEPLKADVSVGVHEFGKSGATVAKSVGEIPELTDGQEYVCRVTIPSPRLWSPEAPSMYEARISINSGAGREEFSIFFGMRTAEFRPDGFWLNGEKTFLRGVCLHHDAGALGAAWNTDAWMRRLLKLKEMGCNAIRMSHNPPAPELLDLCDQLGFLVIDELTDTWTVPKKPNGYAVLFDEWVERDLVDMIHRDRNHPSVIMWSIGNEVGEQGLPDKWSIAERLTSICHREDPTRPTTAGNDNLWAASQPYAGTIDVYGFNYKPHAYADFRDSHPSQPFYGSETASCISTRGYYLFPVIDDKDKGWIDGAPYQVSSYDLYAPAWASKPDYEWFYEDAVPECAGEFVWTGYDYLGEPTPYNLDPSVLTNFHTEEEKQKAIALFASWGQKVLMEPLPSRSSYFGIMDLAGFPKDRFWLYQSRWRPDLPAAHLLPHWTWPGREGEITPVHVYTSAAVGELFLNGESLGVRERHEGEYRLRWDDAIYAPGELKVLTYKDMQAYERGDVWASDVVRTAGGVSKIDLSVDYNGRELIYVTAALLDDAGQLVPAASNEISFTVSGQAEILATDAGDPTSHSSFRSPSIKAFGGLASVIVKRSGKGTVNLRAESGSLGLKAHMQL